MSFNMSQILPVVPDLLICIRTVKFPFRISDNTFNSSCVSNSWPSKPLEGIGSFCFPILPFVFGAVRPDPLGRELVIEIFFPLPSGINWVVTLTGTGEVVEDFRFFMLQLLEGKREL